MYINISCLISSGLIVEITLPESGEGQTRHINGFEAGGRAVLKKGGLRSRIVRPTVALVRGSTRPCIDGHE